MNGKPRSEVAFISDEALTRILSLSRKYKEVWGNELETLVLPRGMSQEQYVMVLEYIIKSGDSVLVGWNRLRESGVL